MHYESLVFDPDRVVTDHMIDAGCPVNDEVKEQMIAELPPAYRSFIAERERIEDLAIDAYLNAINAGESIPEARKKYFAVMAQHQTVTP